MRMLSARRFLERFLISLFVVSAFGRHALAQEKPSFEIIPQLRHSEMVYALAFSPNGARMLTGSQDHTANLWDAETGNLIRTFTGSTSYANINEAAEGTVLLSIVEHTTTSTTSRPLNSSDITKSTQFFNPANGHVYEFVNTDDRWDQALARSSLSSLSGVSGYLVTITSAEEQAFIVSYMGLITVGWNQDDIWIAASDSITEGSWVWMAGPEAGTAISYSDWAWPGGPSNYKQGADYGTLTVSSYHDTAGAWLDLDQEWFLGGSRTSENSSAYSRTYHGNGYVIEYSGDVTETVSNTVWTISADTSSINDPDGNGEFQFQWQQSRDGIHDWNDIAGANEASYQATSEDVGSFFRVQISYTDGGGSNETLVSATEQLVGP